MGKLKVSKYTRPNPCRIAIVWMLFMLCNGVIAQTPGTGNILYVNKNVNQSAAVYTGDGDTWENAIPDLAVALKWAKENQNQWTVANPLQIWVAKGTYKPSFKPNDLAVASNPRDHAFTMVRNVQLYGGFVGTETALSQRNWQANETILSGDLNDNDDISGAGNNLVLSNISDNTCHVVIAAGNLETAAIDGFTITGGNANSSTAVTVNGKGVTRNNGGGIITVDVTADTRFTNLNITGNAAGDRAGGFYNHQSPIIIESVIFSKNRANYGTGLFNANAAAIVINCLFTDNYANNNGGGIYNDNNSPKIINCTFFNNYANNGGAIYNRASTTVANSIIWANSSAIANEGGSNVTTIQHSIVQGGFAGTGNKNEAPLFTNTASHDFTLRRFSPAINAGNSALYLGLDANTTDIAGNSRVHDYGAGGTIDMGAYESEFTPIVPNANNILFVDKNVTNSNGAGNSWESAISELADALSWARIHEDQWTVENPLQIWVAIGTYKPLYHSGSNTPGGYHDRAFVMAKNVQLYGGFNPDAGIVAMADRIIPTNDIDGTILSGDINGNDHISGSGNNLQISGNTENVFHVVVASGDVGTARLDGFTITGGYSYVISWPTPFVNDNPVFSTFGGGIYCVNSSPALHQLKVIGNYALGNAGIYLHNSSPLINHSIITKNHASIYGGGIGNSGSAPVLTAVELYANRAEDGGAIYNMERSNPVLNKVSIHHNHAERYGGGIYNIEHSNLLSKNSLITGNTSLDNYSAALFNGAVVDLVNVTVTNNPIHNEATLTLKNSIIWEDINGTAYTAQHSIIQGLANPGNGNSGADPVFADAAGGDFTLQDYSPAINAGNHVLHPGLDGNTTDLAGNPRVHDLANDGKLDIGAYEFQGSSSCPTGNFTFTTQQQLRDFATEFARCSNITLGSVFIGSDAGTTDIDDLSPLLQVTSITGSLTIRNTSLTSLEGLNNITAIGKYLEIRQNATLTELEGLNALKTVGGFLWLGGNAQLANLDALAGVQSISGRLEIRNNAQLANISGLQNIDHASINGPVGLVIVNNSSLSVCNLSNFCAYLSVPANPRDINGNKDNCLNEDAVIAACSAMINITPGIGNILYVDQNVAGGSGTGYSWNNALPELADALQWAQANKSRNLWTAANPLKIYVAKGEYKPSVHPSTNKPVSGRDVTFSMVNNVQLYGGFDPINGITDLTHNRLFPTSPLVGSGEGATILSGDIGIPGNTSDNAYHVLISIRDVGNALLDGFVITGGNANNDISLIVNGRSIRQDWGGGMFIEDSSPTLTNVTISGNTAGYYGGGMYNEESSPKLVNVIISGNTAVSYGGGMSNISSSPSLTNVTISGNTASLGGGMYNGASYSFPKLYNSIIWGNSSGVWSGSLVYSNSLVQGLTDTNNGNISSTAIAADGSTLFEAPMAHGSAPTTNGNYSLKAGSPAINKGNNGFVNNNIDLVGNPRVRDNTVDLGALEFQNGNTVGRIMPTDGTLYVKKGGEGNGSSWNSALGDLAPALQWAQANKDNNLWTAANPLKIYVAKGEYKPSINPASNTPENDRNTAFLMVNNVQLYGGFDPENGITDLTHNRLFPNSPLVGSGEDRTILSGDIGTPGDFSDNAYHVLISSAPVGNALLDGFAITGGNADGNVSITVNGQFIRPDYGGGINNTRSSPTLTNVIIFGNRASLYGGGMINFFSSPNLTNVIFSGNTAVSGGGLYNEGSSPTLANVTISGNTVSGGGGALYNYNNSFPKIYNSIIWGNTRGVFNTLSSISFEHSLVQEETNTDNGNISSNGILADGSTLFVSPVTPGSAPTTDGDYRLKAGSPAIDMGDNQLYWNMLHANAPNSNPNTMPDPTVSTWGMDLAGNQRVFGGTIDLGAYEVQLLPQTITVADVTKTYGDVSFAPGSSDSGLSLNYSSSDTDVALIDNDQISIVGVGTAIITVSQTGNTTYLPAENETFTLTVTPASLTITANPASKVYDGSAYSGGNGVNYLGFVNGETASVLGGVLNYGGTSQGAENAGTYTIIPQGLTSPNYEITYEPGTLTIAKSEDNVLAFNGQTTGAMLEVFYGAANMNGSAVASSGLPVTYSSSVSSVAEVDVLGQVQILGVGTTVITVSQQGNHNYESADDISFTIEVKPAPLTIRANDVTRIYDGNKYSGGNGVSYTGFVNGETASVLGGTLSYGGSSQEAEGVGVYTIIPSGQTSSNYEITYENGQLNIVPSGSNVLTFNGQTAGATVSRVYGSPVLDGSAVATSGLPVSYSSSAPSVATVDGNGEIRIVGVGTAVITASQPGDSNFDPALDISFTLNVVKASLSVTANNQSKSYDGVGHIGGNGVSYTGFVNEETASVLGGTLNYGGPSQNARNVGSYFIEPLGYTSDNYQISYHPGSLTITKAMLTIKAHDEVKIYDGSAYSGGNGVDYDGFVNGETALVLDGMLNYSGTSQGAVVAGTYTIIPQGLTSPNYEITYEPGQLEIIVSDSNMLTFNGHTAGATVSRVYGSPVLDGSAVATSGLPVTYSSSNQSVATVDEDGEIRIVGVGTAVITASQPGDSNFDPALDISFTLNVVKAPLSVTAINHSKTYDGVGYSGGNGVSYLGFVNGETTSVLGGTLNYGGTSQGAVVAGTYTIIPQGLTSPNYEITYEPGQLEIIVSGSNVLTFNGQTAGATVSRVYGSPVLDGSALATSGLPVTYSSSAPSVATVDGSGEVRIVGVGTAVITASQPGDSNFDPAADITFTLNVVKAPLSVRANPASKVYDGSAYSGGNGVSYTGFVNGETASVLGGTLNYGGTAQNAKDVGTYTIVPSGHSSTNYQISYYPGSLTITSSVRTMTFPALPVKTFGDAPFSVGAVASQPAQFVYSSSDGSVASISATGIITIHGAGETLITVGLDSDANYSDSPAISHRLIVAKASQRITFTAPSQLDRSSGSIPLGGTASSGLSLEYQVDDPQVATISGSTLHILRLGTVRIIASQSGDANHEPAEPVTVTIQIVDPASDIPVRVHQAISPNGDGINDFLMVEGIKDYPENRVTILSRNGTVLWEASGYDNDRIAFRGIGTGQQRLPAGTYFYIVEVLENNKWKYHKGFFVLRY